MTQIDVCPTEACYACGHVRYRERSAVCGGGWVCALCHPDPLRSVNVQVMVPEERLPALAWAARFGYPLLWFRFWHDAYRNRDIPYVGIPAGADHWQAFVAHATAEEMTRIRQAATRYQRQQRALGQAA